MSNYELESDGPLHRPPDLGLSDGPRLNSNLLGGQVERIRGAQRGNAGLRPPLLDVRLALGMELGSRHSFGEIPLCSGGEGGGR